jgi:hypothetical protein
MVTTVSYPVAPTTTPVKGSILDAATVKEGIEWLDGADLFETFNCLSFDASADFCVPNTLVLDGARTWVDGLRFAAYGGTLCKAVGNDMARARSEVERVFRDGEYRAVEQALVDIFSGVGSFSPADDLTPSGGAVLPLEAVAVLESYAAANYVGTPTLHMPRLVASLLAGPKHIEFEGNTLRTALGSKVAAGGGYDMAGTDFEGGAITAGESWIVATGETLLLRGDLDVIETFNQTTNEVVVMGMRAYVAAFDCLPIAGVKVAIP